MNRREHSSLLDRHDRAIAQILTRFRNMVEAATAPIPTTGNILQQAAHNRLVMETEANALISEVQGLIVIAREIKTLWARGPLRQPGQDDDREAELDRQSQTVLNLYNQAMAMRDQAIRREAAARANGGAGPSTTAANAASGAGAGAGPSTAAAAGGAGAGPSTSAAAGSGT
ncbi:hypothetical protein F5Y06DRAFT_262693 [Hypoxylon sp. FL0890]|nr:hypothetical protein F5Y06DRAFT_262693 [Hypoxylon sp. FL0890]